MLTPNAESNIRFWEHAPGTSDHLFSTFNVKISSQGLRDREVGPKRKNETRILLLGDSFTYGFGVEFDNTIGQHLEDLLNRGDWSNHVTVINGGVEGYGPWQERILLNERGFALEPDIVLLQIFPTNDIDNTLGKIDKKLRRFDNLWQQELENRRRWATWPVRLHEWLRKYSALYTAIGKATGNAAPLIAFLECTRFYPAPKPSQMISKDPLYWLEAERKEWYPELVEGQSLMEQDLLTIRDDCEKKDIQFWAYTMPDRDTVCDKFWANCMKMSQDPNSYERGKSARVMDSFYTHEHISFIDVPAAIRESEDPCGLYFINDGHLNPTGTAVVAEALALGLKDTLRAGLAQKLPDVRTPSERARLQRVQER
ncbi:MAG: SGNH/GDSL hydrolase family protein [Candidatus Hydrogenedentes bacterium]|nr:SGNH/GDSL hydrolase family protein [Candidatus Hydrogenedentota bacterium]